MTHVLPILNVDEVRRLVPHDEEAGFGTLTTARGPLPLQAMEVEARIDGLLAEVNVGQTFVNTHREPLEATYIFPLPDRAAVTRFRMEVAGRVIEGVLKERGQARQDYEQALKAGHRAAITEEERPDVFTMRVGNLPPGESAKVYLTLTGPLPYSDGEVTFRFPLVVAPRYIPGTPLPSPSVGDGVVPDTDAVPDASRITPPVLLPGYPNPVRLSLAVELRSANLPVGELRSSLHAVVEESGDGVRRVKLQPGERLDRDFLLRFKLGAEAVRTTLTLRPDAAGSEQGTFLLTLVPPAGLAHQQRPRDVVFVLDRSGSMGGWKMVAARRALARMVDTLTDRDRFAVYAFDDRIETPPEFADQGLHAATNRHRYRAVEFLAKVEARGGTELAAPLNLAVGKLAGAGRERDRILVLVTDGQVGNEDQILRSLAGRVKDLRVFTLGIDRAVNEAFLRRLAALGGGGYELVESEDRLDAVMDQVHRRIGTALLTGLHLEPAGLAFHPDTVVPGRLPDLFAGAPLCLLGRYRGPAQGGLVLQAADAAGRPWCETVQAGTSDNPAVTAVWARGHLRELEDRYVAGRRDLERSIVETSLRFSVLCRFTAFVAVDRAEVVNPGGQVQRITQPVEAPSGWAMLGDMDTFATARCASPPPCSADSALSLPEDPYKGAPSGRTLNWRSKASARPQEAAPKGAGPGDAGSFLGNLFRSNKNRKAASPPPTPSFDATAYCRRVLELGEALKRSTARDVSSRLTELGVLAVKLQALIADLRSTGAPETEVRPLQELLDGLRALLALPAPVEADVTAQWAKAEQTLQAFAGGSPAPSAKQAKRREGFWK